MKKNNVNIFTFGTKKPEDTRRNKIIKRAVRKAVKDYRETFIHLASV